ncbi:hypothetical protein GCM10011571_04490 [Marinithermofilum abyssi]|uniref:Uncharacterized protein n=1 Tax=Marinithermofilum abyssi TaxID=1571185 RepID=A0A8J2VE97_9BACL|nr:hypothetical protein GCM10011571_04490 [Marinithermofilum abyssi]
MTKEVLSMASLLDGLAFGGILVLIALIAAVQIRDRKKLK